MSSQKLLAAMFLHKKSIMQVFVANILMGIPIVKADFLSWLKSLTDVFIDRNLEF